MSLRCAKNWPSKNEALAVPTPVTPLDAAKHTINGRLLAQDGPPQVLQIGRSIRPIGRKGRRRRTRGLLVTPELDSENQGARARKRQQRTQDDLDAPAFAWQRSLFGSRRDPLRPDLAGLKRYFEPALGHVDKDRIVGALRAIIFGQFLPQTPNVHAHHGFLARIVGLRLGEYIQTDRVLFQAVRHARKRFLGQVLQKISVDFRRAKGLALNNPLDLYLIGFQHEDHRHLSYGMLASS